MLLTDSLLNCCLRFDLRSLFFLDFYDFNRGLAQSVSTALDAHERTWLVSHLALWIVNSVETSVDNKFAVFVNGDGCVHNGKAVACALPQDSPRGRRLWRNYIRIPKSPIKTKKGSLRVRITKRNTMPKKLSYADWVAKFQAIHGEKYTYLCLVEGSSPVKITYRCPVHGEVTQLASNHKAGKGCALCSPVREKTDSEWISAAKKAHNDTYAYLAVLRNRKAGTALKIKCRTHGEFTQLARHHIAGSGCPSCSNLRRHDLASVAEVGKALYPEIPQYLALTKTKGKSSVTLVCPTHGEVSQDVYRFLHLGHACPKCAPNAKLSGEDWVMRAKKRFGEAYTYTGVSEIEGKTHIHYTCPTHGSVTQLAKSHLKGAGCAMCFSTKKHTLGSLSQIRQEVSSEKYTNLTFTSKSRKNGKCRSFISFDCQTHGRTELSLDSFVAGRGCRKCNNGVSNLSLKVEEFLKENKISFESEVLCGPYRIDFVIHRTGKPPLALELNGLYWHSSFLFAKTFGNAKRDVEKTEFLRSKGYEVATLFEDEINDRWEACSTYLKLRSHKLPSVGARKGVWSSISKHEAALFLEQHHLQGPPRRGTDYYAFRSKKDSAVLSVAVFDREVLSKRGVKQGVALSCATAELVRFCGKVHLQGGFSRLLSFYRTEHPETAKIVSYVSRRLFSGEMYKSLAAWRLASPAAVDYCYTAAAPKAGQRLIPGSRLRVRKSAFQKSRLLSTFADSGIRPEQTELEMTEMLGFPRLYYAGTERWELLLKTKPA
jgi:very-short-patch-repair endonuclease